MVAAREIDIISVCVCTYQRPTLLARLLEALAAQVTDATFAFDVVVVDNDVNESSKEVVRGFATRSSMTIIYDCEPERNISLTRNRAIRNATGNLVAFIDDDECPGREWLRDLRRTLRDSSADGVLAPVLPDFPPEAPQWLRNGRVFHRKRHATGSRIGASDARTGNVLLDRSVFADGHVWFDPAFGRTGGEDSDFFSRQFRSGRVFVWCDEAVAYETVPPERWTAAFHIKRLWRSGTISGERMRDGRLPSTLVARNLVGLGACAIAMPVSFVLPKHIWMRVAQKFAYCAGVVTAYLGLSMFRHRD
jgi:glycosyltransferase involved in cell wall biosynthesis